MPSLNPFKNVFKPIRPAEPPAVPQYRINYGVTDPDEKPWSVWYFAAYIVFLLVLWLVAKPVIDGIVDALVDPLSIAGYLDFTYQAIAWILFIGLFWIGFSRTFRSGE